MRFGWRSTVGIALSVALLWWALRGVSFVEVWGELRRSNLLVFALATIVATSIFPLRARRWKTILDPVVPDIPFGKLWRATAIGMMVNNVVPARAGEFARAYALTREEPRVHFGASMASLAIDRAFDAIVLMLLMVLAMFDPVFPRDTRIMGQPTSHYVVLFAAGVGVLLVLLYAIVFFPQLLLRAYDAVTRRLSPRLAERGRRLLGSFTQGLSVLRSPTRFFAVLWWTVLHWLVNGLAFWLGFRAVGIDVPYSAALFMQGLIAIGVALPSSPGFFGVFEAFALVGLAVYGVPETQAVSWAIGYHILSFIPITVMGAFYFARLGLHFRELGGRKPDAPPGAQPPAERPVARASTGDA